MVKTLGTHRDPTPEQNERVANLKAAFGKGVKAVRQPLTHNGYLPVVMTNAVQDSVWFFDLDGKYVERHTQLTLDTEGTRDDTTRSSALPQADSQY